MSALKAKRELFAFLSGLRAVHDELAKQADADKRLAETEAKCIELAGKAEQLTAAIGEAEKVAAVKVATAEGHAAGIVAKAEAKAASIVEGGRKQSDGIIEQATADRKNAEGEVAAMKATIDRLTQEVASVEKHLASKQAELEAADAAVADAVSRKGVVEAEISRLKNLFAG